MNKKNITLILFSALALILLVSGTYFLVESINAIPANLIVQNKQKTDKNNIDNFLQNLGSFPEKSLNGKFLEDLSLIEFNKAMSFKLNSPERKKYLLKAKTHLESSLAKSPASPYAWLRLAYIYIILDHNFDKASTALNMSVITGPYEQNLVFYRLKLFDFFWDRLPQDQKSSFEKQIKIAWDYDQKRTLKNMQTKKSRDILKELVDTEDTSF